MTPSPNLHQQPSSSVVSCELKQSFKMLDVDSDGRIPNQDLKLLLRSLATPPLTEEELEDMINELDTNGDGSITLDEFCGIGAAFGEDGEDQVKEAFDFFDTDGDGKITAEELYKVFGIIGGGGKGCTLAECRRMIARVDVNGDGFVCFQDFCTMMDLQHQF